MPSLIDIRRRVRATKSTQQITKAMKMVSSSKLRRAQERTYRFVSYVAGDAPGFEEAVRALYARDGATFAAETSEWPRDVRDHALRLAAPVFEPEA